MRNIASITPLAMVLLSGCLISPFDGTWLFSFDAEPVSVEGTCVDQDDTTTTTGDSYDTVDMYTNDGNGIVVLMEMGLHGTVDGKQFTASGIDDFGDIDWSETETVTISGTLAGKVLSGRVVTSWMSESGTTQQDCTTTWSYNAERIDSDPDDYTAGGY